MRKLNWFEPGEPLAANEIAATEELLGVKFPADYAALVGSHSGASSPRECEFIYVDRGKRQIGSLGVLLALKPDQPDRLVDAIRNLGDQIPVGVIPIIETGWGDFVCLDYRESKEPTIAYFSHELSGEDSIIFIANSVSEFLDSLYVPEDDEL